MYIQKVISEVNSFEDLASIVKESKPKLSFWATPYIVVNDYSGTLPIDALADKTMELVRKNFDFSAKERKVGKEMASFIDKIFEKSDLQVKSRNFLTRMFNAVRVFFNFLFFNPGYDPRFCWETDDNEVFDYYTKNQFKKAFGYFPTGKPHILETNCPDRWNPPDSKGRFFKVNFPR